MLFELLAIQKEESKISSIKAMLYLLCANDIICGEGEKIDCEKNLVQLSNGTNIHVESINNSHPLNDQYYGVFKISVSGEFNDIEQLRISFINYLLVHQFIVFISRDEVSQNMTQELYPLINDIETKLRSFLITFFIKIYGTDFWDKISDKSMNENYNKSEQNLDCLKKKLGISKLKDSNLKLNIYGIEFRQLGEIIYGERLGSAKSLDETIRLIQQENDIDKLKCAVSSLGYKFFRESFLDNRFQSNWKELTRIRHIIAHNNICLKEDYELCKKLVQEIKSIIMQEEKNLINESLNLFASSPKNMACQTSHPETFGTVQFLDETYSIITPERFLDELETSTQFSKNTNGYVGLKWFVTHILYEKKGFAIGPSYAIANQLETERKISITDYIDSKLGHSVKAVELIDNI